MPENMGHQPLEAFIYGGFRYGVQGCRGFIQDHKRRILVERSGQSHLIVGENGSGKTTFIKLLCRLYDPTEGSILLNGIDITRYRYEEYLGLFSVVFQDYKLFQFSLAANVAGCFDYQEEKVRDCLVQAGFGNSHL